VWPVPDVAAVKDVRADGLEHRLHVRIRRPARHHDWRWCRRLHRAAPLTAPSISEMPDLASSLAISRVALDRPSFMSAN